MKQNQIFTRHKIGGEPITNPTHGLDGWCDGEHYIYDGGGGTGLGIGWCLLSDYQKQKEKRTGKTDHRLHDELYYSDRAQEESYKKIASHVPSHYMPFRPSRFLQTGMVRRY